MNAWVIGGAVVAAAVAVGGTILVVKKVSERLEDERNHAIKQISKDFSKVLDKHLGKRERDQKEVLETMEKVVTKVKQKKEKEEKKKGK